MQPHPGPLKGCSAAPDSVILSNSNDMLRSIWSSAMVFSVFCIDTMLMFQCAKCSACICTQNSFVSSKILPKVLQRQISWEGQACKARIVSMCCCTHDRTRRVVRLRYAKVRAAWHTYILWPATHEPTPVALAGAHQVGIKDHVVLIAGI